MKCILTIEREVMEFLPYEAGQRRIPLAPPELVAQCERRGGRLIAPPGTVINDPECYKLVLNGVAVPADDECREKDTRTPEQVEAAEAAFKRLQLGIHPDDFKAYQAGEMVGYQKDGTPIPGPNAKQKTDDDEEE